jgi:nitrogen regulatory protein PII
METDLCMTIIVYRSSLDGEVMENLDDLGLTHYTKWVRVLGSGTSSEPCMDTHIWPGTNNALAILVDSSQVKTIYSMVKQMKTKAPTEGIKAFTLPITSMT